MSDDHGYLNFLHDIAKLDVEELIQKDKSYGASWKKRGGVGAYFVMIRKADRLETQVVKYGYDIFKAIEENQDFDGILDDVRDLRRYLMLIEAEMLHQGKIK